jgi:hypothetical protein
MPIYPSLLRESYSFPVKTGKKGSNKAHVAMHEAVTREIEIPGSSTPNESFRKLFL